MLADRVFGDQARYERLDRPRFSFVIRCRDDILVQSAEGESKKAAEWVPTKGRIVDLYGRRFTIEETFRDQKHIRFGMGLSSTHIEDPARRDRLLMLAAFAQGLLTLLGAASEASGLDRVLKANMVKKRTHSLFRRGSYRYFALPNLSEGRLRPLLEAFGKIVADHEVSRELLGII